MAAVLVVLPFAQRQDEKRGAERAVEAEVRVVAGELGGDIVEGKHFGWGPVLRLNGSPEMIFAWKSLCRC
jgi:hypothetical protein